MDLKRSTAYKLDSGQYMQVKDIKETLQLLTKNIGIEEKYKE